MKSVGIWSGFRVREIDSDGVNNVQPLSVLHGLLSGEVLKKQQIPSIPSWHSSNEHLRRWVVGQKQWRSQPKSLGAENVQLLASNSVFVWDAAIQSTKWTDMLKIWGVPWLPGPLGCALVRNFLGRQVLNIVIVQLKYTINLNRL